MIFRFGRLAAMAISGAILALAAPIGVAAHAQCDPSQCTNPNAYQNLPTTLAPRTFSALKAAKVHCRSEPIVWRTTGGQVYSAKSKGYGKIKPGFYMCRSHAETVARINAESGQKPR
ncbi:hypothetical protein PMI01_05320 [Caulobacter sp. AP07]|uniref:hypothetical protein n=1 Tax=Caulobacter sp. AP07 TaxID=1144304 RepID=UPI000271DA95|nr:hypothetical protein [Caulobacter sp. AP07]EJL21066.1 hypothetical protein PMI01_05320 [Caulobacter sp. AP07]